jgi:hypothetical protein
VGSQRLAAGAMARPDYRNYSIRLTVFGES